jgi:hypothetical protein
LWRWAYGAPALALVGYEGLRVLRETPVDVDALQRMSVLDPMNAAATLVETTAALLPPVLKVAEWLAPLLLAVWVVASSLGRTVVLRWVDEGLHARPGTLMVLQSIRMVALASCFAAWFACLRADAGATVNGPIAAGQEPKLVLYSAIAIGATLGMFTLWAVVSWVLSVAPLLAMMRNLGAAASLTAAFQVRPVRGKLIEINLVMGIVKIALMVLAMVFSACPLPFESVATPGFMLQWYAVVTLLYLVASDFFHVVRLVYYLEMWKAYDVPGLQPPRLMAASPRPSRPSQQAAPQRTSSLGTPVPAGNRGTLGPNVLSGKSDTDAKPYAELSHLAPSIWMTTDN